MGGGGGGQLTTTPVMGGQGAFKAIDVYIVCTAQHSGLGWRHRGRVRRTFMLFFFYMNLPKARVCVLCLG